MIWLFKLDEVFWNNKPEVNQHFVFNIDDINFDMYPYLYQYSISLYFATANYYLLSESNDKEIYLLHFIGLDTNPSRTLISEESEIYDIVRSFYLKNKNKKTDEEFQKWVIDNWSEVLYSDTRQPTGMYVHKSNDVKVENFTIEELRVMHEQNYEPIIIHPTWEEIRKAKENEQ